MYQDYFGLSDLPFRVTPEPQFLFSNPSHRSAYAALSDGIISRRGLIVITGEIGTGKTTLLTTFLQSNLDPALQSAVILNPSFSFTELLRFALRDLGIPCSPDNETELLERFNHYAAQETARGRNLAVFLDEAQTISLDVLNQLLRLANLDSDEKKLVQVILIGQPELEQKLNQPELAKLRRRVSLQQTLVPLTPEEVGRYIDFRLRQAGYQGKQLFDRLAVQKIVLYSGGIPRLINIICDNALLIALGVSKKRVSARIVDEVAKDLHVQAWPVSAQTAPGLPGHKPVQSDAIALSTDENLFRPESSLGQRYASRTLAAGFGILLVFGVLTGVSSMLYDQGKNLVSRIRSGDGDLFSADANSPPRVQSRPQGSPDNVEDGWADFGQLKMELSRILMKNKERTPDSSVNRVAGNRSKYLDDPQTTAVPANPSVDDKIAPAPPKRSVAPEEAVLVTRRIEPRDRPAIQAQPDPRPQSARGPQYWPHQPTTAKPPRADREQRFFQGVFEVTADSLVFDEPRMESALLKRLPPGSQVRVEQKQGSFLLVRSLKDPEMSGYVHLDHAYFRRIRPESTQVKATQR
jgi:type II secretory pathway predicted ATPase ExeA